MNKALPLLLVAGLVAAGLFVLLRGDGDEPPAVLPDIDPPIALDEPRAGAELDEADADPGAPDVAVVRAPVAEQAVVEPPAEVATNEGRARIFGRFLLPGGAPAPGVALRLRGRVGNSQRALEHGVPEDWQDPAATTAEDGTFELRLDPPRAFQFFLDASLAGYGGETWRWGELAPDEQRDLGTLTLRGTGTVEGRVVDASGAPSAQAWRIFADAPAGPGGGEGRDETRVSGDYDPAVGSFHLEGVPVGPVTLTGRNSLAGWLDGPTLDVRLGEVTTGDITYKGADLSRRIEVSTFCRTYYILSGGDEIVRLTGPGIDATTERTPGTSQSFAFDDLGPGPYTVTVEHELFETVVREGLEPGQRVNVDLVPSGHLGLTVTDAITGEPIEAARLQLRLDDFTNHSPNAFLIHEGELPSDGMLPPIVPGNTTLIIEAEGYALLELPVLELAPFETRAVTAALTPEAGLAGTVRWSTGEPAGDVELLLMRPGEAPAPRQSWFGSDGARTEGALHQTRTDAEGRYAFRGLTPGIFDLHAVGTAWLTAGTKGLEVRGGVEQDVDLTLPAGGSLRLVITDLDPVPEGFEVAVVASAKRLVTDGLFGEMGPYGSMRIGLTRGEGTTWVGQHLPAGLTKVVIGRHELVIPTKGGGSYEYGEQRVLDEIELQDGLTTELVTAMGDALPGTLHVEVLKDGLPQPGVRVRVDGSGAFGGTALTGQAGMATITGLFPGEFQVRAILPSSGEFKAREGVVIPAGQTEQIRIETGTILGYVRVLDPSGQPLAGKRLDFSSSALNHRATTDEDGRAKVRLVPGPVRVELRELDKEAMQWVHWRGELAWPGGNSTEAVTVQLVEL